MIETNVSRELRSLILLLFSFILFMCGTVTNASAKKEWVQPIKTGQMTDPFSSGRDQGLHDGVDYDAGVGKGIYAAHAGTVTWTGYFGEGLDKYIGTVILVDTGSWILEYQEFGGNSNIKVKKGDKVDAGQKIATEGPLNGSGTGPHLHLGITKNRNVRQQIHQHGFDHTGWFDAVEVIKKQGKVAGGDKKEYGKAMSNVKADDTGSADSSKGDSKAGSSSSKGNINPFHYFVNNPTIQGQLGVITNQSALSDANVGYLSAKVDNLSQWVYPFVLMAGIALLAYASVVVVWFLALPKLPFGAWDKFEDVAGIPAVRDRQTTLQLFAYLFVAVFVVAMAVSGAYIQIMALLYHWLSSVMAWL